MPSISRPRTKRVLLTALLLLFGGGTWFAYTFFCPRSSRNQASAIEATLVWGRLAPFPGSAQQFRITTAGSPFTRAFRATFIAPPADLEQWLQQSPGTRRTTPTTPSRGIRHFEITPGGGAQWAEVTVDDTNHRVSIYVYWS
jgi:hypothetical protein